VRLVDLGIADTRTKAQALILAGTVYLGEVKIDKAGTLVAEDASLIVRGAKSKFVSRGGDKLAGALDDLAIDPRDLRCLDLGASTGGFTDCLLQRGAAKVAAVDVGYGQLAQKLRDDPRVLVLERTNGRTLEPQAIGGVVDLTVVDASFIGLGKLVDAIARCTRPGGVLVALVKPQFEVGREVASKTRGVVRDEAIRRDAIDGAAHEVEAAGFVICGRVDSRVEGPKGNREAFLHAVRR
jgi:23S rRNA (cytidine1920-2'-O)/16S rRNA (cytidine1409-2'-O)-methyltransferase